MIHNIEDKTQKELVEIVKIQMEEYAKLNKLFEAADKAHTEIESQWLDMKQKLEAAERERDDSQRKLSALSYCIKNQVSSFYDARNYEEAVNAALVELNKFAIEQQIKGIYEATNYVADNNDISYLSNDFILELCEKYAEQLRQQLNGGE